MRKALEDLIEAVEAAINAGDWKVDGACDPTLVLIRAKEALAQPDQDQDEVDIRSLLYQRIHELETQLAQPKQEPVGEAYLCDECLTPFNDAWECPSCGHNMAVKEPVYTTPPQRKPLTDEQIKHLAIDVYSPHQEPLIVFARAIEAAHGIKE